MANTKYKFEFLAINKTRNSFNQIKTGLKGIQKTAMFTTKAMAGTTAAFAGAAAAVGAVVLKSTDFIDTLVKTADKLDVNVEFLQKFRFAAEQTGVETRTADMALQRFSRRLGEAKKGTGELLPALKDLGIRQKDIRDLSPEQALLLFADRLDTVQDSSKRLALAFKAFDSEGAALINTLKGGSTQLQEFFDDATSLGAVLSVDAARGVADFADEFTRLKTLIAGVTNQLTAAFAPALETATETLVGKVQKIVEQKGGFETFAKDIARAVLTAIVQMIFGFQELVNSLRRTLDDMGEFFHHFKDSAEEFERMGPISLAKYAAAVADVIVSLDGLEKKQDDVNDSVEEVVTKAANLQNPFMKALGEFGQTGMDELKKFSKDGIDGLISSSFQNAFKNAEDALVNFVKTGKLDFKQFVDVLIADLARIQIRKLFTSEGEGGIFGSIFKLFRGFDGGGYTGMGNRTGGVDGKGGFPAILHPNETVIDHTKGESISSSPVSVNFNIQATDARGVDEILMSRKNQIVAMVSQAMNQKGKAGLI
jgi:hypothetical protein